MKVLNVINFEIYSTENKKSMKAFKQGCQTIFDINMEITM